MRFSREENGQCEGVLLFAQRARGEGVRRGRNSRRGMSAERELDPRHWRWMARLRREAKRDGRAGVASDSSSSAGWRQR